MENLLSTSLPTQCPNEFPTLDGGVTYRIALIGEAPGADEVVARRPFVGVSGRWLDYLLNRVGIMRSACFVGNICQIRPPSNLIELFDWNGPEIQNGLTQLSDDLLRFHPHLCVLFGNSALRAGKGYSESVTKWRGSLFTARDGFGCAPQKCIATFHPASSLRTYEQTPLLLLDLKRARSEGETRQLCLPNRTITVLRSVEQVCLELQRMRRNRKKIGTDIEGYVNNLTCISFADDPLCGYVIPFTGPGGNFWSEEDEFIVWKEIKDLLEDTSVPKVLQNGLYDRFVLAYTYGILVRGVSDDTMLGHWELYCELEKKLSVQCSIYTKEPYYKDERGSEDWEEFWNYNGKDSCVTLEINLSHLQQLKGAALEHYKFNVAMQDPLLYMELRGMCYDQATAKTEHQHIEKEINLLQHELNKSSGRSLTITSESDAISLMREVFCIKRGSSFVKRPDDCFAYARKPFLESGSVLRAVQLCAQGFPFDDARNGEFSRLLERHLNTDSNPQMIEFLYTKLDLPVQKNKDTKKPTADATAILKLFKRCEKLAQKGEVAEECKADILKTILRLSSLLTQLQTLDILCDPDGRIRCSYNVVGSKTGRLSCSKSPTRSGYNLQTVTKKQRRLFRPDPGHVFFQCDLSGADGWTVAADCKRLGDPTLLEDLRFGLKPAKIIARMYEKSPINQLSREQIKVDCQTVDSKGWLYMGTKRVQHGTAYDMKPQTMSDQILEDSYKYSDDHVPVLVPYETCAELQHLVTQRYPGIEVRKRWISELLQKSKSLTSANGNTRKFFGRPTDPKTKRDALSNEPQQVTTYLTNMAVLRSWLDPKNRKPNGELIVEIMHQIHDAGLWQTTLELVDFACRKLHEWFDNPLTVSGETITIPFEGAWGESWSPDDLKNPI